MSKFFIDTEFVEGPQDKTILGFKYGITKPTIDLISIGIVSEDRREYYAISKDFNLKEAWNRYQMKQVSGDGRNIFPNGIREYWIRENVLYPIFRELCREEFGVVEYDPDFPAKMFVLPKFTFKKMKSLIKKYGKTNDQIAKEIKNFVYLENKDFGGQVVNGTGFIPNKYPNPEFYAYYADYDHVVFCWLWGKMIDLPEGFPKYCRDLKQMLDEKALIILEPYCMDMGSSTKEEMKDRSLKGQLKALKGHADYPSDDDNHHALVDAKWGRDLYWFINKL